MDDETIKAGQVLLHSDDSGKEAVSVAVQGENFWLAQSGMADLFGCTSENILRHLKNISASEFDRRTAQCLRGETDA